MNPKIRRNFEIFTPCDFIAAITQHIPDKNFQLVRYYGWYSNSRAARGETGSPKGGNEAMRSGNMRGQRLKQAGEPSGSEVEIIDVSGHRPRRSPSPKWREMRIVALIAQREVIERILRHLGLWTEGVRLNPARAPPEGEGTVELFPGDPFPDYGREPVMDYDLCANG